MFRSLAAATVITLFASATPAMAADDLAAPAVNAAAVTVATPLVDAAVLAASAEPAFQIVDLRPAPKGLARGGVLPALYVSLAGLNAFDAITTLKGTASGAVEANSLMRGAAGSPVAMMAVKGGVTAGSIVLAERLWRSGHRAQAIGMMIASNAMMAAVGVRNSHVIATQR
jgi:hypothetical protein